MDTHYFSARRAAVNAAPPTVPVVEYGLRRTLIVVGVMLAALLQRLSALVQQQAASAGFADAIFALVPVAGAAILVCLLLRVPRRRAVAAVPAAARSG